MAVYCYKCPRCGAQVQTQDLEPRVCGACIRDSSFGHVVPLVRDYKAEGVGVAVAELRKQRETATDGKSGREAMRDVFLPTADDYRSPKDPTGQKGVRDWAERHAPRPSNKQPLYPSMDKKVF